MNEDEIFNEKTRIFKEFLKDVYESDITKLTSPDSKSTRLIVNLNQLRTYNIEYCNGLLNNPMEFMPCLEKALTEITQTQYHIGLTGNFGDNHISPSALDSSSLGKMIYVEAIVTRCSLVRPKVVKSVHYCEKTMLFSEREYRDGLSLSNDMPTFAMYPRTDDQGNLLTIEYGASEYKDFQMIHIQEMPERSLAGQLPSAIDVVLGEDLVNLVKPGDRIFVVGCYRTRGGGSGSSIFSTLFLANHIGLLNNDVTTPLMSDREAKEIKKLSKRTDIFDLVSSSLAPSIYGHEYIKKALLLLMLGGVEKNLENGTHLRGDINVLLIGDPSVGKSQMLRFVLNLAPLAIATTGRGSSGVGLTAAVTQDKETGERTLEAGAMVLADRGIVCIDEFDKMNDIDRVAIHEVMEQQTVTIAKAGIHTSLNARCSVLAAANPAFGSYMDEKKPFENITMPDSLLSRFDLVFVVLDKTDDEFNRAISEHITRLHRYTPPGLAQGAPMTEEMVRNLKELKIEDNEGSVFEKYDELLHIGLKPRGRKTSKEVEILSIPFLKKYLYYAKNRVVPVLTPEASDFISTTYSELRAKIDGEDEKYRVLKTNKTMPITPRTLETLIRLATAHAKCRLSKTVDVEDTEIAYEVLMFALFKEVKKKRSKKSKVLHDGETGGGDNDASSFITRSGVSAMQSDDASIVNTDSITVHDVTNASQSRQSTLSASVAQSEISSGLISMMIANDAMEAQPSIQPMSLARFEVFGAKLGLVRTRYSTERDATPTVTIDEIMEMFGTEFERIEVVAQLQVMSDDNMSLWYQPENNAVLFF